MKDDNAIDAVAIIGMACRFPGAETAEAFWDNLVAGRESITVFSDEELLAAGISPEKVADPNFVKARGLIRDPECFDAAFFGISPREAELMDPQQRLFLETCWHALESAGHVPSRIEGSVGVWGGMSTGMTNNTYLLSNLHADPSQLDAADVLPAMLGNENDYLTTRVSYKLNLRGPSINVQSACSTSLVAAAQAFQSLMTYGCDVALAGGVSVSFPQKDGYLHQEGDIGSPDGHCRPFDENARGTVFSNGVGVVAMKRLEDALADGDTIYAVLRGAAINNDGSSKVSFAAPSVDGQAEVIATAQAIAGVAPESISYVETHGTGTAIGDPIEVAGLTKAFGPGSRQAYCGLGSVKSNFGHLDSAAGIAALIKATLCLHHKTLVPTLHYHQPNPNIDFSNSPFYVCQETVPWQPESLPRRAGVSGFGIGGTNAHLVLEEAPPRVPAPAVESGPQLLVASAKTEAALKQAAADLANFLARPEQQANFTDIAYSLVHGREQFRHRLSLVATDAAEAAEALAGLDRSRVNIAKASAGSPGVVFMFPGGGVQHPDMGADLYRSDEKFRSDIDAGVQLFMQQRQYDLEAVWFPDEKGLAHAVAELERPAVQLPALFILEMALARWWRRRGVEPRALIGHSLGENTAACLAGILRYEDALGLVSLRGELFEQVAAGGMLSVPLSADDIAPYLNESLCLATINAPDQCTVSGTAAAIDQLSAVFERDGVDAQRIPIHVAAHSHLLEPILQAFGDYLRSITLNAPTIPMISNLTGDWLSDAQATDPDYWVSHLRHTVRFAQGIQTLSAVDDAVYLELGPGKVLGSLLRLQQPQTASRVVSSLSHPRDNTSDSRSITSALGQLWSCGVQLDWPPSAAFSGGRLTPLPLYPFQRKRFLVEPHNHIAQHPASSAGTVPPAATADAVAGQTIPVTANRTEAVPQLSREERILHQLTLIIQELSGLDADDIDPQASFVDMGFDSLFLTQANLRFKKAFRVKITFRQLFDEAPCLHALAAFIDQQLPADALPATPTVPPAPDTLTVAAPAPSLPVGGGDALMQALALQVQASNALISILQGGTSPVPAPQAVMTPQPAALTAQTRPAPAAAEAAPVPFKAKSLGPYKPLDTNSGGLTASAKAALDTFVKAYSERTAGSKTLANEQRKVMSDARSISGFRADWKEMVYQIASGSGSKGSRVFDIDGNEYVDLTSGFGVNLFGYSPDAVVEAIEQQLHAGFELGNLSPLAKEVAELIHQLTGMDRCTFTNTGSEAISAAIRAARTTTGKDKIAVFYDEYHGISDEVLVNYLRVDGERKTIPTSPGIPQSLVDNVIVLEYDDPRCIDIIRENADDLAAIIIEPVQNRNPAFRSSRLFPAIREVTRDHDIAMVFDEMITGFRLHPGGAQAYFGIDVDICCYGKIVCGGLPLAVVAGRGQYLDCFDGGPWQFGDDSFPEAGVTFFGGTYTRHPLSLASSVAALRHIKSVGIKVYDDLNARSRRFANQLNELLVGTGYPARIDSRESILNLKFNSDDPFSKLIFWYLRHKGVLIYDRPFFISTAHSDDDFAFIRRAFADSIEELQHSGIVAPTDLAGRSGHSRLLPFTESQAEIWLASQMGDEASRAYNEQVIYHLQGAVDIDALRHALQKVAARHEGLRATVAASDNGLSISPARYLPLPLVDLSETPDLEREQALQAIIAQHVDDAFDLHEGPLTRLTLVKMAEDHCVLLWAAHHIVVDGWSMGIMLKDLADFYGAARRCETFGALADEQLSSYMQDESAHRESEEYRAAQAFWLSQYAQGIPDPVELPLDYPRPPLKTYRGERLSVVLDGPLVDQLRQYSHNNNCTLFTTLFSAFSVLLHKLTGQNDLVIGVPVAGQAVWGRSDLVGHCVSFLPFRVGVDPQSRYSDLLAQTRDLILDANEHQHFTYGGLLRKLPISRDPARTPLVSAIFNLDQGMEAFDFDGVDARYAVCPRQYVKHDLFFNIVEDTGSVTLEVDHNTDLFKAESVMGWVAAYQQLLQQFIDYPQRHIAQLQTSDPRQSDRLIEDWNDTRADYPLDDSTLISLFEAAVDRSPDRIAVTINDENLSYAELDTRANQLAHYLRRQGVGPDGLVPIIMERSLEMVVALYGTLKAGGAYLPLDPDLPDERLHFMLQQSGATIVLCQAAFSERVGGDQTAIALDTGSDHLSGESTQRPAPAAGADHLAYVIYTSGSTGEPKGVMIEHRAVCNRLLWMAERYPIDAGDSVLQKTPYTFDVSVWELFLPLLAGARLVLAEPGGHKSPEYLSATINHCGVTLIHFVPSMLYAFLAEPSAATCTSLKRVICSGEALSRDLQDRFFKVLPQTELHNLYGPTEAAIDVSYWQCDPEDDTNAVAIGKPVANTQLYVLNAAMQSQPPGVIGELYIGGVQLARGYLNRPDLTEQVFLNDHADGESRGRLYRTGDLVRARPDGALEYIGRNDTQVKIRGFRIELSEIEAVLNQHSAIDQCVVLARRYGETDQRLIAYVCFVAGDGMTNTEMRRYLRDRLPEYMIPQHFVELDAMPLSPNGKIDRRSLPEPLQPVQASPQLTPPSSDTEHMIAAIWRELLQIEEIDTAERFFDIGGHSLLALEAIQRLEVHSGVKITPLDLLLNSLAEIAAQVDQCGAEGGADAPSPAPSTAAEGNVVRRLFSKKPRR